MATSSFGGAAATSASAAAVTENARKFSVCLPIQNYRSSNNNNKVVAFRKQPKLLRFSSKGLQSGWNSSTVVRAQINEVAAVDGSSNAATPEKSEGSLAGAKDVKLSNETPSEESISEFLSQVASLIKLVDSKDIVELELKQLGCELLIRKKEALEPAPSPPATYYQPQPQPALTSPAPTPSPVTTAAPSPASAPPSAPPKAQPSKSSHAPFKCPMAGTFYRSPGPSEPPFVKVGDKVQKGQVICIIEAMKLMNEIEADQSGTLVEVIAQDGKPVSVDTPLFVIEP